MVQLVPAMKRAVQIAFSTRGYANTIGSDRRPEQATRSSGFSKRQGYHGKTPELRFACSGLHEWLPPFE